MTGSRSSAFAATICVAAMVAAAPLGAQVAGPIDIVPRVAPAPSAPAGEPPAEPPLAEPAAGAAEFEVEVAATVDPEAVGLLEEADGGFGLDMWRGTSRSLVERMLPRLAAGGTSRARNDLTRRLLLSTAIPPEGEAGVSLLALRIERLAAMGEGAAMNHLLRAAPPDLDDAILSRARLDAMLLTADHVGACAQARDLVRRDDAPYWEKVLIFCHALAGQHDAAALGVALLRERGIDDDPAFELQLRALSGEPDIELSSLRNPTALHVAMLREARVPVPEDAVATAGPAIARAIALTASAPLELRIRAAERAEAVGALPTETLAELYASVPLSTEDLASPLSRAAAESGPMARALLYQAVRIQVIAAARAEVLRAFWRLGRERGGWDGYATAARVALDTLLTLTPSPELAWIAGDAARALFAAGRPGAARAWLERAEAQAGASADAAAAVATLWPIARIADGGGDLPWDATRIADWWNAQDDVPEPARRQRAELLYGLLAALGDEVPTDAVLPLLEGPLTQWSETQVPAMRQQIEAAAAAGRVGESVLLALVALAPSEFSQPDPVTVAAAVSAIRRVGLVAEARALALEAVLAREL